ncbi:MAG: hypothetical protein IPI01_20760 [Ignavibacteriae bacterium]|nr:hypothetical protein [Ignavibacteriota bacterium]
MVLRRATGQRGGRKWDDIAVIDKDPTDQTVIVGATATFTVQASGRHR